MECVILYRNIWNNGVGFIGDEDEITVFQNMDEAIGFADTKTLLKNCPYQIIELTEL